MDQRLEKELPALAMRKPVEIRPLKEIGELYLVALYDRLAGEASQIFYVKSLELVKRILKNSCNGLDPFEIEVYLLGIFNTHTLRIEHTNVFLDYNDFKAQIKRGLVDETR